MTARIMNRLVCDSDSDSDNYEKLLVDEIQTFIDDDQSSAIGSVTIHSVPEDLEENLSSEIVQFVAMIRNILPITEQNKTD